VGTANSQKKSPRSSAKSEKNTANTGTESTQPGRRLLVDNEELMDRSPDLVAAVSSAEEAAQREMESFGHPSEYEVTIIHGQKRKLSPEASQSALDFESGNAGRTD
jgi:hypothetical protein